MRDKQGLIRCVSVSAHPLRCRPGTLAGVALWKGPRPVPRQLDPHQLHHGPYHPPALRRGDRATCLLRDGDVVIAGWSDARIPWPRCRRTPWEGHRPAGRPRMRQTRRVVTWPRAEG